MGRGLSIGGSSSVQRRKVGRNCSSLQICFRRFLCNKTEIDQFQCVICCVLGNYDMIISDALEKQNQNGEKNARSLILVTNIHREARASQRV